MEDSMYHYYVESIEGVVDGDSVDVIIDLGFDLFKHERIRLAGIDTPEKRTRNLEEKELGVDASVWLEEQLVDALAYENLIIRTEREKQSGKYGRTLGWLWLESNDVSINEQMITEGYAWPYDGGTKEKNLEDLRAIRREMGTLK